MRLEKKVVPIAGDTLIEYTLHGKHGCFVAIARWEHDSRASVARQLWAMRALLRRQEHRTAHGVRLRAAEQRQKERERR